MASTRGSRRGKKQEEVNSNSPSKEDDFPLSASMMTSEQIREALVTQDSVAPTETAKTDGAIPNNTSKVKTHMSDTSIMEFSSDLNDAEAPPPLPVGEYPAEIVKAEIKDSKAGNKYLALTFKVHPESFPADFVDGNPEGEQFGYNRVTLMDTAQGRYRVRKFNEAVGAPLGRSVDPNDYMGLTATVAIKHGKWEGEDRAEIEKVLAA